MQKSDMGGVVGGVMISTAPSIGLLLMDESSVTVSELEPEDCDVVRCRTRECECEPLWRDSRAEKRAELLSERAN